MIRELMAIYFTSFYIYLRIFRHLFKKHGEGKLCRDFLEPIFDLHLSILPVCIFESPSDHLPHENLLFDLQGVKSRF